MTLTAFSQLQKGSLPQKVGAIFAADPDTAAASFIPSITGGVAHGKWVELRWPSASGLVPASLDCWANGVSASLPGSARVELQNEDNTRRVVQSVYNWGNPGTGSPYKNGRGLVVGNYTTMANRIAFFVDTGAFGDDIYGCKFAVYDTAGALIYEFPLTKAGIEDDQYVTNPLSGSTATSSTGMLGTILGSIL
jgi:hypothetical protein